MTSQLESLIKTETRTVSYRTFKQSALRKRLNYYGAISPTCSDLSRWFQGTDWTETYCCSARATVRDSSEFLRRKHDGSEPSFLRLSNKILTKVAILKEVNFGKKKLCRVEHFWPYLSSHLGVIAEYNSNHAQMWRQIWPKVFNSTEFLFSEVYSFKIGTLTGYIENFYKGQMNPSLPAYLLPGNFPSYRHNYYSIYVLSVRILYPKYPIIRGSPSIGDLGVLK